MRRHAKILFAIAALTSCFAFAGSASAADSCPNAAIRAQQGARLLPDCRAYEQVSPVDKGGNDALFKEQAEFASRDGERFVFAADASGAFGGGVGSTKNQYLAQRSPDGWESKPMSPRPGPTTGRAKSYTDGFVDFACDACARLVGTSYESVASGDNDPYFAGFRADVYLSSGADALQWLSGGPIGGTASQEGSSQAHYGGRSSDGSHIAFDVGDALLPEVVVAGVPASARVAYERTGPNLSELRVVGKDNSGAVMPGGSFIGGGHGHLLQNAVSEDGEKIFFQSPDNGAPARLYVRIGGTRTVEVSAPQCSGTVATCDGVGRVNYSGAGEDTFLGASPDGNTAYFMSPERLVDSDANGDLDVYRYDLETERLTQVSRGPVGDGVTGTASVQRVSSDGSTVVFASTNVLTNVPNAAGELPVEGAPNQYVYRGSVSDPSGEIKFIGGLSAGAGAFNWQDGGRTFVLSPDGTTMAFPVRVGTSFHTDIYRYDWYTGRTVCLTCSGAASSVMFSQRSNDQSGEGGVQGVTPFRPSRNLSDDGHTVFFETASALSPKDVNGKVDVYEWHDGNLYLLSSGTDRDDSYFMDAGADGRDVFIATRAQMAPTDTDRAIDIYDVRSGGGWLAPTTPECSGEGCQGTPGAAPGAIPVGSSSLLAPRYSRGSARTTGRLRIQGSRTVRGTSAKLLVTVPAAGRIRVSGPGLKASRATAMKAGRVSVTAKLTRRAQRKLKHGQAVKVRATVTFAPAQGRTQRSRVRLSFRSKKRRSSHRQRRANALSIHSRKGR